MANIYTDIKMFDAEYYLANNPDVAAAIEGTDVTAQDHYFLHGAAENRAPNSWFNAAEYAAQNADLAGVDANLLLAHFALHGVNEGRAPNAATAGADGKIKPELLADYVNAEGNEDVKAAIAEITGALVGAELTAEQATIAAQHFFNFGINEGRKGGIADEISGDDNGTDIEAVVEALEAYQAALTAQADAEKAEQDIANAAAKNEKVAEELTDPADEKGNFDVDTVSAAVDKVVGEAEDDVKTAGETTGELSDTKIANAEKVLQAKVDAAQSAVAEEAANAPTVVALQQQLLASQDAVDAVNAVNLQFEGEKAKFKTLNEGFEVKIESAVAGTAAIPADPEEDDSEETPATPATPLHATIADDGADANFVVAVVGGKAVVYSGEADSWKDGVPQDGDKKALKPATEKELENLKGLDALLATIVAVKGNEAVVQNANKAIEKAVVDALAADGYKLFDKDGKEIKWSKAKFDKDGKLELAGGVKIAKSFKDGDAVDPLTNAVFYTPLAVNGADEITVNANVDTEGAAVLGGGFEPTNIDEAAKDSAAAVGALKDAEKALETFQDAVETYNELKAIQTELADAAKAIEDAGEAVTAAEEAFEGLGVNLVKNVATDGTVNDEDDEDQPIDLFVYSGQSIEDDVANFDGDDLFFFGDTVAKLIVLGADFDVTKGKLGGAADVLEIFAQQVDGNTVLYVEKAAFAGNSANDANESDDFATITLTGVNAEDLQFNDGFLMFA